MRADRDSLLFDMVEELNTLARVLDLPCRAEGYYPGWPFEAESKMRELLTSCCQEILGKTKYQIIR